MQTEVQQTGDRVRVVVGDDRTVAADVTASDADDGAAVWLHFYTRGGAVPQAARESVVTAVFELPLLQARRRMHAAVPIGDAELIRQLAGRCARYETRAAGATCLIDGVLAH